MKRVAVVGATGYTGAELIRLLLGHPDVVLTTVVSKSRPHESLTHLYPALTGRTELSTSTFDAAALANDHDAVFLAVPHGHATELAKAIDAVGTDICIFDLSADHRLNEAWVYGLVEWQEAALKKDAQRIAVPGCFATAIGMATAPFVQSFGDTLALDCVAMTGSTGLGASAKQAGHHPERFINMKPYKVLQHQHHAEIMAQLGRLGKVDALNFVPISAPLDRGILATCFITAEMNLTQKQATQILKDAYADCPLVRVRETPPEVRHVRGSAYCDVAVVVEDGRLVAFSVIDNLLKGAAAQAIQCMNVQQGVSHERGLRGVSCLP